MDWPRVASPQPGDVQPKSSSTIWGYAGINMEYAPCYYMGYNGIDIGRNNSNDNRNNYVNNQISHKHCNKWLQNFNKAKIYLIYNCSLTRHHRGETYRLLWTKLSHHLECVPGIVQPWPS